MSLLPAECAAAGRAAAGMALRNATVEDKAATVVLSVAAAVSLATCNALSASPEPDLPVAQWRKIWLLPSLLPFQCRGSKGSSATSG